MPAQHPVDGRTRPLRDIEDLPGPPGLPLFGNALQVRRHQMHLQVEAWVARYGDLFRIRFGKRRFLVLANPETVVSVMRERPGVFGRTAKLAELNSEAGLDPGVFAANGDDWRRQRSLVMASFDPGHIKSYFPTLLKVAQRLERRWQRAAAAGAPIDLQGVLKRYTVDGLAGLAFGSDINTLDSNGEVIQQHLDCIFPLLHKRLYSPIPYWRWFKLPSDRVGENSVAQIKLAIAGFIAQARARIDEDPGRRQAPQNLIEAMVALADQQGSGISTRDVSGNVLTMLIAGEDTTANSLAWLIYLLHRHPPALQRAMAEVRALAVPTGELTPAMLSRLPYLDACIEETMRLKPVVPFVPMEAYGDTVVDGIRVPAGTLVWCVLRRLDDRLLPRANDFVPERWLEKLVAAGCPMAPKRISLPFGAGPRICPGRYLALLEIKLAMAVLLSGFEIDEVETPDGGPAQERVSVTMWPVGLRLRLSPRRLPVTADAASSRDEVMV